VVEAAAPVEATAKPVRKRAVKLAVEAAAPAEVAAAVAAPPVTAPPPATAPLKPRRRLRLILGLSIGGFAVLVIAALGITYAVLSADYAASASVDRFLTLVVKGQSSEAVKTMDPAPVDDDALVDDDVYASAKHRITSYKIESTKITGHKAVVEVKLKTDSGAWEQSFDLVTSHKFLLFDAWTIDGGSLPTIDLTDDRPDGVSVTANGVQIQKNGLADSTFFALPGDYRFAIVSDSSLVKADSHDAQITTFDHNKKVELQVQLTDDGVTSARAAVDTFLNGCISQEVLVPDGDCGYEVTNDPNFPNETLSNILWSIKQRPVVSFDAWEEGGWTVKTETAGVLEMDADFKDARYYGTAIALFNSYDIQGYVEFSNDTLVFKSTYEGDSANQPNV
jgi:hypothetical protein